MIIVGIQIRLVFRNKDRFQGWKFADFFCVEVCRFVKYKTVSVTENISREPSWQSKAACTYYRSETRFHKCLSGLEIFTGNRHLSFFSHFPHSRNINCSIWSTHYERSTFCKSCVCITHRRSNMFTVIILHCFFKSCKCSVYLFINWNINFCWSSPKDNNTFTIVFCFKFTDIFTQLLYHFPASSTIFYVITVKTLCIITVESSLHRLDGNQLIFYRINILFL